MPAAPPPGLKFVAAAGSAGSGAAATAAVAPAGAECWGRLPPDLQRGVQVAAALRAAVAAELGGMTVSCGVARSKLVARQAGPAGKPDGLVGGWEGGFRAWGWGCRCCWLR